MPVSVKTRIGYNEDELEEWLPVLLSEGLAAIIIHCRTRKEMSNVPAHWERVQRAAKIRDELGSKSLILGNGDVADMEDARDKARTSGADGVMLGRAVFGNPWLFHPEKDLSSVSLEERLTVMLEHTKLFIKLLPFKNFSVMKKHYKAYITGFDGAGDLRVKLMMAENGDEVALLVEKYLSTL